MAALLLATVCVGAPVTATAKPKKKATTISGVVWSDADGDGVREQGEALVAGVKVTVSRKSGKSFKPARTLTTTKNGGYSYAVRTSGKFRVAVVLPAGFATFSPAKQGSETLDSDLPATGGTATFTVRAGGASKRIDAGLRRPAPLTDPTPPPQPAPPAVVPAPTTPTPDPPTPTTPEPTTPTTVAVGDVVWSDTDQDGRRDAGEPGLAGVHVELRSASLALVSETTTAANGSFTLTATIGTTYRLRADLPPGGVFSPKNIGVSTTDSDVNRTGPATSYTDLFTASASLPSLGIGIFTPGTSQLGNLVFEDRDGNGIYADGTDREMSGVRVNLWNESRTQIITTTTTSTVGAYALQAPRGVNYYLEFVAPGAYYVIAPQDAGADDTVDSDIADDGSAPGYTALFTVGASPNGTIDAGFIIPINLGDRVWDDVDGDGIQDTGEPGLAGVTVQLWNAAKTRLYSTTTSSSTGNYLLRAPGATTYRIRAILPSGAAFSPKDQGGDEQKDSDINPTGANLGFTDVLTLPLTLVSSPTYDIGIDQP